MQSVPVALIKTDVPSGVFSAAMQLLSRQVLSCMQPMIILQTGHLIFLERAITELGLALLR
jgi:hypothetical protein